MKRTPNDFKRAGSFRTHFEEYPCLQSHNCKTVKNRLVKTAFGYKFRLDMERIFVAAEPIKGALIR